MTDSKDERFKLLLMWKVALDAKAPAFNSTASGIMAAQKLSQHLSASLLMSAGAGIEAPSVVDPTPLENCFGAWRRLVHRFDPLSSHANLNFMSNILTRFKGHVENIALSVETCQEMVRRQDEQAGRQALADDPQRASLMDMCPVGLERQLLLNLTEPGRVMYWVCLACTSL